MAEREASGMASEVGKSSSGDPFREPDTILDQRFRVMEFLGEGPVHSAHRAWDILEGCEVCLKIPKPKFRRNEGFTTRYRRDLLDIMMLSDNNWLTPLQLAEHDGVPFQVLPMMEGVPFLQWFEESQRSEVRLVELLSRTLKTLERMKRLRGRLHGSIKPSNLYVTGDDEPVFTDLAATGRLEDHFSEKALTGEPVYCAPEQMCGERADAATDLYSLAVIVYEALARRHPFLGQVAQEGENPGPEGLLTSLLSQLQSPPPAPSNFSDDVPRWADRFLLRCLQPHPEERFPSFEEARSWLKSHSKSKHNVSAEQRTLAPPGREKEMKFLEERLRRALAGDGGSIVRLRGEVGCGKTRCLNWLSDRAKEARMRVVWVSPIPESGLHLQSVITALSGEISSQETESRPVVETLLSIAMEEPLLMVIRDIQQADGTLVEFLREVQTVLNDLPMVMVLVDEEGTFRSEEMRAFVAGLKQDLRLLPLDRRAIANLIEEKTWTNPTPSVCSWVHAVSGGNALHATLLVEYLQAQNLVSDALDLSWTSSPPNERPSLQEVIAQKIDSLSPLGRSLLEIAAVLGNTFRLSTLNAITYRNDDEVDQALGEGAGKGLVELASQGGAITYRWKHPTFRNAVLQALPPRRRQRTHRLAAAYYSRGVPEPSKMAYHFLRAGDTPELFYWGSLAVEKARSQNRRGESIYWMNVLMSRIPEHEWLGPEIQKARREVTRDQAEALDLERWPEWFRTLSGRNMSEETQGDPLMSAQNALSSNLGWEAWKEQVEQLLPSLLELPRKRRRRALLLLVQEWQTRCGRREPFPAPRD